MNTPHPEVIRAYDAALEHLTRCEWRQGRSQPRNVYAVVGETWEDHFFIGHFFTPELAAEAVAAHNERLRSEAGQLHSARLVPVCEDADIW